MINIDISELVKFSKYESEFEYIYKNSSYER